MRAGQAGADFVAIYADGHSPHRMGEFLGLEIPSCNLNEFSCHHSPQHSCHD